MGRSGREPMGAQEPEPEPTPEAGTDFADEHESATFADEVAGGPEEIGESEAPEGYAGMESRTGERRTESDDRVER
jgi:hypothetical protein